MASRAVVRGLQEQAKGIDAAVKSNCVTTAPKKDASGKPIPGTSEGTLVRIRLFDDRERVLLFKDNDSPTAKQVCEMISSKLEISPAATRLFSLWIVSSNLELQIRPKMEVKEMIAKWFRYTEKYTHGGGADDEDVENNSTDPFKLVFRREAMAAKAEEAQIHDDVAMKLLYGETRNHVTSGRYPLADIEEAALMSSLQAQVSYGDFDPKKHGPGTEFIEYTTM